MTLDSIRQEVYDVAKQAALDALREHDQGRTLEPLLSIARVAELLGYPKDAKGKQTGISSVHAMIDNGSLRAMRMEMTVRGRGRLVVKPADLRECIERGEKS